MTPTDHDHDKIFELLGSILSEIKDLRTDTRDIISKQSETLNEEKRRVDEALRLATDARNAIWKVGGIFGSTAAIAIAKAMGLW